LRPEPILEQQNMQVLGIPSFACAGIDLTSQKFQCHCKDNDFVTFIPVMCYIFNGALLEQMQCYN
jgi:hypothetical protein